MAGPTVPAADRPLNPSVSAGASTGSGASVNCPKTVIWALLLLAPSILIIAAIVLYPVLQGAGFSFREMQLTRPDLGTGLVGFRHYRALLADEVFAIALRNTALWVVLAIGLELALGLASALALNRRRRWRGAVAALILIPWFLPNVIAANIWALMLDPRLGVINDILVRVGLLSQYKACVLLPV